MFTRFSIVFRLWPTILCLLAISSCSNTQNGTEMPTDALHYPMGAVLLPETGQLLVPSSNFDLRYGSGNLHLLDLEQIENQIAKTSSPPTLAIAVDQPRHCTSVPCVARVPS